MQIWKQPEHMIPSLWYCHAVLSSIDVDKANNPNDPRPIKGKTLHQEEQYSQRVASFVQYIFALIDVLQIYDKPL